MANKSKTVENKEVKNVETAVETAVEKKDVTQEVINSAVKSNGHKVTNFNAMYETLVWAHNTNNRKAITSKDALCDPAQFLEWCKEVDTLYTKAHLYQTYREIETKEADNKRKTCMTEIFALWKSLLQAGEEKDGVKTLKCYNDEVMDVLSFAWKFQATENGTVRALEGKVKFRKYVETLIGCKIAAVGFISVEKSELISLYESAIHKKKNCLSTLNGHDTEQGEHVPGLNDQLKAISNTIETFENIKDTTTGQVADIIKVQYDKALVTKKDLEDSIKSTKETLAKHEKTIEDNQTKYQEIMVTIKLAQ